MAIDGRTVMTRVRSECDRFVGFVVDGVKGWVERIAARPAVVRGLQAIA